MSTSPESSTNNHNLSIVVEGPTPLPTPDLKLGGEPLLIRVETPTVSQSPLPLAMDHQYFNLFVQNDWSDTCDFSSTFTTKMLPMNSHTDTYEYGKCEDGTSAINPMFSIRITKPENKEMIKNNVKSIIEGKMSKPSDIISGDKLKWYTITMNSFMDFLDFLDLILADEDSTFIAFSNRDISEVEMTSTILCSAWSEDGKYIVSGTNRGELGVIESESGKVHTFQLNTDNDIMSITEGVVGLCTSVDGRFMASNTWNGHVVVRSIDDENDGKVIMDMRSSRPGSTTTSMSFSPDGKQLICGQENGDINIWNISTGCVDFILNGHDAMVRCAAFGPDGTHIVSIDNNGFAIVWSLVELSPGNGNVTYEKKRLVDSNKTKFDVDDIRWNPDGSSVMGRKNGSPHYVMVWNVFNDYKTVIVQQHSEVLDIIFDQTGRNVLTCGEDGCLRIWDSISGDLISSKYGFAFDNIPSKANWEPRNEEDELMELTENAMNRSFIRVKLSPDGSKAIVSDMHTITIWEKIDFTLYIEV